MSGITSWKALITDNYGTTIHDLRMLWGKQLVSHVLSSFFYPQASHVLFLEASFKKVWDKNEQQKQTNNPYSKF